MEAFSDILCCNMTHQESVPETFGGGGFMKFEQFLERCRTESTVGDFESYLAQCIFEEKPSRTGERGTEELTVEGYSLTRDLAFERRDEKAARLLYDLADAVGWREGEWEGALR